MAAGEKHVREAVTMRRANTLKGMLLLLVSGAAFLFASAPAFAAATSGTDGHWELIEAYSETESDKYEGAGGYEYTLEGSAEAGFRARCTYVGSGYRFSTSEDERPHKGSCKGEYGESFTSFSPLPPSRLTPGDELSMTATVSCSTSGHKVGAQSQVLVSFLSSPSSNSYIYFRNDSGKSNDYVVSPGQEWVQEGKGSSGFGCFDVDTSDVYHATVPDKNSWYASDELYIRFDCSISGCKITSYYRYGWVESMEEVTAETEPTSDGSGGEQGDEDNPDAPRQNIVIDTDASRSSGITGGWVIPAAIVIGAAAVAAAAIKLRKGGSKGTNDNESKQDDRQSIYRMVLYKDFGNELRAGGAPKEVSARIEERVANAQGGFSVRLRNDLTQKIVAKNVENLELIGTAFKPPFMTATIRVPESVKGLEGAARKAVLAFTYTGSGGTFTNNVTFKLAADPQLLIVEEPKGTARWFFNSQLAGLIGDAAEGSVFYFGVSGFTGRPETPDIRSTDSRIAVKCESYEEKRLPHLYVYKATVTNTISCESSYGLWPFEHKLHIAVKNGTDEQVEDDLKLNLWPEGISFDMGAVKPERRGKDSVVVDTGDILMSSGTQYNIEGATIEVAVAYKDTDTHVTVTRPTKPDGTGFLRLAGVDEESKKVLNPEGHYEDEIAANKAPRVWYTLDYLQKPSYSQQRMRGSLVLVPLMPAVSKKPEVLYGGYLELAYDEGGHHYGAQARFDVKGISSAMDDADVAEERARIKKLLNAYKLNNWTRVAAILEKHGPGAERELMRLGTAEERQETAKTVDELMRLVDQIQSLQRLRAIRKMVYEACDYEVSCEGIEQGSLAFRSGYFYYLSGLVRWAADLAFTCWCYSVFKSDATYIVPFTLPLKRWVEDGLVIIPTCLLWDESAWQAFKKHFSYEKLSSILVESLENEFLAILADTIVTGFVKPGKKKGAVMALGAAGCFFFAKNMYKHAHTSKNGGIEFDWWGVFKDTTLECTAFGVKAVLSIVIARRFSAAAVEGEAASEDCFVEPNLEQGVGKVIVKSLAWALRKVDRGAGVMGRAMENLHGVIGDFIVRDPHLYSQLANGMRVPIGTEEQREIWAFFYDVIQQGAIDGARSSGFDEWLYGLGSVEFEIDAFGAKRKVQVPYPMYVSYLVDWLFDTFGFNEMIPEIKLEEDPTYYSRDDLIEIMKQVEMAGGEIDFLLNPKGTDTDYSTCTTTGVRPVRDSRGSYGGTDVDTSTDTA